MEFPARDVDQLDVVKKPVDATNLRIRPPPPIRPDELATALAPNGFLGRP